MDHAMLPAMVREEITLMRMFSFSFRIGENEFTEMREEFGEIWAVIEDQAFNLVSVESLTVCQWDTIEELDNWLHDTHKEWSSFQV
jgi:hypothetical protein